MKQFSVVLVSAFASAIGLSSAPVRAQNADAGLKSIEELSQENAVLRKKIEQLELDRKNARLRERVRQLEKTKKEPVASSESGAAQYPLSKTAASAYAAVAAPAVVAPPPIYTWTGFYVGGNVGGSWGDARTDIQSSGANSTLFGNASYTNPTVAFADTSTQRLNGLIGGGQVGYNYQVSPHWVLGLEADMQGSSERGSSKFINSFSSSICNGAINLPPAPIVCTGTDSVDGKAVTTIDAKIGWFGTVRGRLGFLIDDVLVYGTGGLAYGQVKVSGNANVNGSVDLPPVTAFFTPGVTQFSASKTNVGFALGAGIEGKFAYWLPAGWTWKLEYLYVDLGSLDTVSPFPAANPRQFATAPFIGTITTHTQFTDNIVRVGVNYKLF